MLLWKVLISFFSFSLTKEIDKPFLLTFYFFISKVRLSCHSVDPSSLHFLLILSATRIQAHPLFTTFLYYISSEILGQQSPSNSSRKLWSNYRYYYKPVLYYHSCSTLPSTFPLKFHRTQQKDFVAYKKFYGLTLTWRTKFGRISDWRLPSIWSIHNRWIEKE